MIAFRAQLLSSFPPFSCSFFYVPDFHPLVHQHGAPRDVHAAAVRGAARDVLGERKIDGDPAAQALQTG